MNGYEYRCVVSSSCTSEIAISSGATLTIYNECICTANSCFMYNSIGEPANGLEHNTIVTCETVPEADGYSFEYSDDGIDWAIDWAHVVSNSINVNSWDTPNTPIYYRVRSYSCTPELFSNYTYASPQPIYTACDDPAIPTVNGVTSNSLNLTLNAEIPVENPSYTNYSIYCETTGQYVQANGTLANSEVFKTKYEWGTKTITGLSQIHNIVFM